MSKDKYIQDLREIKEIMSRSSRFISLSGLSGVSAGVFALMGAYMAYKTVYTNNDYSTYGQAILTSENLTTLLLIAMVTLVLSIGIGIYFTTKETKKQNQKIWDHQTKRLLINLAIPLITGGILCLMLLLRGYVGIVAPLTLIFYGLALVNASKYTLSEIRSLGLAEIVLGLISMQFIGFGLLFWSVGFGVLHIVYGAAMQMRYKS
ncbi:MAG TPA: hypothetical protein VGA21_15215 [Cyclobacteriaceae bacterium]|jgi:hypothetical protein